MKDNDPPSLFYYIVAGVIVSTQITLVLLNIINSQVLEDRTSDRFRKTDMTNWVIKANASGSNLPDPD